jgi:methylenetetrahydrofolate--tRNA-(uracil-5-)-methyltransferase
MLPGLQKAHFTRLGMIHRNTYINSPEYLDSLFRVKGTTALFVAGQISGVEGYLESAASGLSAAFHLERALRGLDLHPFPAETSIGALAHYISFPDHRRFQPTNVNYGIFPDLEQRVPKKQKRSLYEKRAWKAWTEFSAELDLGITLPRGTTD